MKITKLGHACVLVETEDRIGLFDPGRWSDEDLIGQVKHVDRIIYTHEHGDHFDIDILKSLLEKFPEAHVICNKEIENIIINAGVIATIREESQCTRKFEAPHEELPIPGAVTPAENGYHFKDLVTHPGDSHTFFETKKVLLMPFVAPWGKIGDAVDKAIELKPEYVLPIHDWFYTDEARDWLNNLIGPSLKDNGIELLSAKSGIVHKI